MYRKPFTPCHTVPQMAYMGLNVRVCTWELSTYAHGEGCACIIEDYPWTWIAAVVQFGVPRMAVLDAHFDGAGPLPEGGGKANGGRC